MAEPQAVPTGKVAVISPQGKMGHIAADKLDAAVAEGYRPISTADANARLFSKEHGATGAVRAFGESAASAATLGLSDVAGGYFGGDEWREQRKQGEEAYGIASGLGTAAGVVAPALISGGASALARGGVAVGETAARAGAATALAESGHAAGAATRGMLGLGRVATAPAQVALGLGRGAEALVGGGQIAGKTVKGLLPSLGVGTESLAGRVVTGGAKMAASGAVEGAAFGAGQALSETALAPGGDYSHLAEKVLAGATEGGLFGAALGGGLGAVGGVASKVVSKMAERIGDVKLDKRAGENAVRAIANSKSTVNELAEAGELTALGNRLVKDDIVRGARSYDDMLERAQRIKKVSREAEATTLDVLDGAGRSVETAPLIQRVRAEIVEPLAKARSLESRAAAKAVEKHLELLDASHIGYADMGGFARSLDDIANPRSVAGGAQLKLRNMVDDAIQSGVHREFAGMDREEIKALALKRAISTEGDAASAAAHADAFVASMADGGALRAFKDNKESLRAAQFAEEQLLARAGTPDVVAKGIHLTSAMVGAAPLLGEVLSGGLMSRAVTGAGLAAATQFAAKHGRSIIADLAYRASKADTALLGKVKAFVRGTGDTRRAAVGEAAAVDVDHALNKAPKETRGEAFERMAASVRAGPTAQPMVVDAGAPGTGAAMRDVIQRGMAFLATKLPPGQDNPSPFYTPPPASAESVAQFARYVKAVKDPLTVLDSMNNGTISSEEVEALKVVYPRLYDQVKETISQEVIARKEKKPLPEAKAVQLGVLFGIPTIPLLEPGNYQIVQASYTVTEQNGTQTTVSATGPLAGKIAKSFQTDSERLESGEMQL